MKPDYNFPSSRKKLTLEEFSFEPSLKRKKKVRGWVEEVTTFVALVLVCVAFFLLIHLLSV